MTTTNTPETWDKRENSEGLKQLEHCDYNHNRTNHHKALRSTKIRTSCWKTELKKPTKVQATLYANCSGFSDFAEPQIPWE